MTARALGRGTLRRAHAGSPRQGPAVPVQAFAAPPRAPGTRTAPSSWTSASSGLWPSLLAKPFKLGPEARGARGLGVVVGAAAGGAGGGVLASAPPPLEEWLVANGGTVNGVALRTTLFPSGLADRQLVATQDHAAGSLLLRVPRHLQLRYDNVLQAIQQATQANAEAGEKAAGQVDSGEAAFAIPPADARALAALFDAMPKGSDTGEAAWQFKQALTILYHLSRGTASPLLPYLAYLPGLAPGVPTPRVAMLMDSTAVDELQYGLLVQDIRNQQYWLRRISSELAEAYPGQGAAPEGGAEGAAGSGQDSDQGQEGTVRRAVAAAGWPFGDKPVDARLFAWAAAVAMSRCFGLARFRTHTCVPLVDMANHAPAAASCAEMRSGEAGEVCMFTKRDIKAGEELTLTYGSHDNHNLLLSYGFTLQPNPHDALCFDLDLATVESLVDGLGEGGGGLGAWQRRLIASKLGLRDPEALGPAGPDGARLDWDEAAGGGGSHAAGSDSGAESVRVYLSAVEPAPIVAPTPASAPTEATAEASREQPGEGGAGAGRGQGAGVAVGNPASSRVLVAQPVDPRLMAAVRIGTLHDETWSRVLAPRTAEQIGAWPTLLAREHEVTVMRLLSALCTALYSSFPTTIQQDRQLLASATLDVAAAAAAVTLTASPSSSVPASASGAASELWALYPDLPTTSSPSAPASASAGPLDTSDPDAAAVAAAARDGAEAVRFRLGLKSTLERCLQALVARAKQLDGLATSGAAGSAGAAGKKST
ncbi:hypothetical protein HYH03_004728 [Edaphochlamys debaryana]|uniref:SET domain-containing protein n=1 Tax=Edaphochlamys debaryana TaxID=47281 RepID=A0A835Y8U7_9CHLO|nr:hypothetical protein HYH03_004728 [Edaphochlamys debaryana]|eukprot:KAG2497137.1 hypothetical protein HYH03_004728 [Edaphochlamys debaryana]